MSKAHQQAAWKVVSVFTVLTMIFQGSAFLLVPHAAQAATAELFSDNFERGGNSNTVGNGWEEALDGFNGHGNKEEIRENNANRFARLHGENNNGAHAGHPKAAISHEIPPGGATDALLTFQWRTHGVLEGEEMFEVIVNGDQVGSLNFVDGQGNDYNDAEISLSDGVCHDGALLTFRSTANGNGETIDIDNVRVTCEEAPAPPPARITVVKETVGGDGEFSFSLSGGNLENPQHRSLDTGEGDNHRISSFFDVFTELDGATYTLTEDPSAGWNLSNVSCEYENQAVGQSVQNGEQINVEPGDEVTCTFINTLVPPQEPTPGVVTGYKFHDLNGNHQWDEGEPPLSGWTIYLDDPTDESGPVQTQTNLQGQFSFGVSVQGQQEQRHFVLSEEQRTAWEQTAPPSSFFDVFVNFDGNVTVQSGEQSVQTPLFGNRDAQAPQSTFLNPHQYDHQIIETELLPLNLVGQSTDNASGVVSADLTISRIQNGDGFPAPSFFDIFTELSCQNPPEPIDVEIVSLSLQSVNPLPTDLANWQHNWQPEAPGIYCFSVSATDAVGNVEHTALAGPVAYLPTPEISSEGVLPFWVDLISPVITWLTDHPATSRVVYDTVAHPAPGDSPCPVPLALLNCYGYAFSTPESDFAPMVFSHSVTITGLTPGTTYYYRVVSHGSPEGVGGEHTYTVPTSSPTGPSGGGGGGPSGPPSSPGPSSPPSPPTTPPGPGPTTSPPAGPASNPPSNPPTGGQGAGAPGTGETGAPEGEVLGLATENNGNPDQGTQESVSTPSAAVEQAPSAEQKASLFDTMLHWWWLLAVIILAIFIYLWSRRKKPQP